MNVYLFGSYVRIDLPPGDVCLVMRPSTAHTLASVIEEGQFGRHEIDGVVVWLKQQTYPGWTNLKFDGWRESMTLTDQGRTMVANMIRRTAFTGGRR